MHELCAIIVGEVPDKNHHNVEHTGAEGGDNLPHGDAALTLALPLPLGSATRES